MLHEVCTQQFRDSVLLDPTPAQSRIVADDSLEIDGGTVHAGPAVMQHPNAALACRLWTALSDGDAPLLRQLLAPAVIWRAHGDNPFTGEAKGIDELFDLLARSAETVDDLRSELRDIYASDRGAVFRATTYAERGPKLLHTEWLVVLRIEDGRVVEVSSVPVNQRHNDEFWRLE